MKIVVFVALIGIASAYIANLDAPAINEELIREINSANGPVSWVAGRNKIFEGMTLREVRNKMLGGLLSPIDLPRNHFGPAQTLSAANVEGGCDVSTSYNVAEAFPACADMINTIRDQGRCGSCWAFAASEMIQDRFCIATDGSVQVVLSPQDFVSCDNGDFGCSGGYLETPLAYSEASGLVSDECFPYTSGETSENGDCLIEDGTCPSGAEYKKYFTKDGFDSSGQDTMCDSLASGPIEIGFSVYEDFLSYKKGVYYHVRGGLLGGHAVKIIGWGVEQVKGKDMKYWLVANSWSDSWGANGFFKIRRGTDECGLESQCVATYADTTRV